MKKKILNPKKYTPECRNCEKGKILPDGVNVFCAKKGIKELNGSCMAFRYDPLKRIPKKAPVIESVDPADFEL